MTAAFERRGLADLAHILVVEIDQVAERPDIPQGARFGRSVAVDIALHLERPFFSVLAPSERLGLTALRRTWTRPVSRCQLSEGRYAGALRLSCARCVHREIKENPATKREWTVGCLSRKGRQFSDVKAECMVRWSRRDLLCKH